MQCRGVTEIIFPPTSLQPALTPLAPEQQKQGGTLKASVLSVLLVLPVLLVLSTLVVLTVLSVLLVT